MKKYLTQYYAFVALLCCVLIASCDTKKAEIQATPRQNGDAGVKTMENMKTAYKSEKIATAKYEAFSKKAEEEGYHAIAVLYSAASAAENIHAMNSRMVLEDAGDSVPSITAEYKVKTTKVNLYNDINGEAMEATKVYPDFLKTAETANNQIAFLVLSYARKTELKHKLFFQNSLDHIKSKSFIGLPTRYFVCPDCGNTYDEVPKHCDFSLTPKEKFIVFQ
jgi:rubrerythrin